MTPVETLTAAIALYEQRREGVTEGPWWTEGTSPGVYANVPGGRPNGEGIANAEYHGQRKSVENAQHIASWSPSVTDPVVQAWRALRERLAQHPRLIATTIAVYVPKSPELSAVDRAVLASATAYLAGAA